MKFQYRSFLLKEFTFERKNDHRIESRHSFFQLFIHLNDLQNLLYQYCFISSQMRTKDLSPYFYPFQVVVKLIIDRENEEGRHEITT